MVGECRKDVKCLFCILVVAMSKILEKFQKLTEAEEAVSEDRCFSPVQSSTPVGIYRLQAKGTSGQIGLGACSMLNSVSPVEQLSD